MTITIENPAANSKIPLSRDMMMGVEGAPCLGTPNSGERKQYGPQEGGRQERNFKDGSGKEDHRDGRDTQQSQESCWGQRETKDRTHQKG